MDENKAREWLGLLITEEKVAFSTQKSALNGLAFFFRDVCGREKVDLRVTMRETPKRIPVVLNLKEVSALLNELPPTCRLAAELQYGCGLRISELVRLRIKDIDLDRRQIVVRGGKGDKDRVTVLPDSVRRSLHVWKAKLREQFESDRATNVPGVALPGALARKMPQAGTRWEWQWVFPARDLSPDPETGIVRRHHILDRSYGRAITRAARKAGIEKRVTSHALRHSVDSVAASGSVTSSRLPVGSLSRGYRRRSARYPHARERRGHPHAAGATRACRRFDYTNLSPRRGKPEPFRSKKPARLARDRVRRCHFSRERHLPHFKFSSAVTSSGDLKMDKTGIAEASAVRCVSHRLKHGESPAPFGTGLSDHSTMSL